MESLHDILQRTFLGNTLESYAWFAGIILAGLIFKKVVSKFFSGLLYRLFRRYGKHVGIEKFISLLTKPFSVFVMLITVYLAFNRLEYPESWQLVPEHQFGMRMLMFRFFEAAMIVSVTWIILRIVDFIGLVFIYRASLTESRLDDQLVPFAKEAVKIILGAIGFLAVLGVVFNLDVVSLVTGLGIGGLAFALAAKETLENLLGSFTIFIDKPFVVGDVVKVGSAEGTVENIGFRSTRIRTLEKTLLTVPNKKMVDAELDNLSERVVRRAKFTLSLTYETTGAQLQSITHDLLRTLNTHPMLEHNAVVRFLDFNVSSLDILVIYFVKTSDWEKFAEVKEELNFRIMSLVKQHGSDFAYPTSRVLVEKS